MAAEQFKLPVGIVTRADVGRLMREAEAVDNFLSQAAIRTPGTSLQLPKTSKLLEETVTLNKLNLLQQADRQHLNENLKLLRFKAPTIHVSFNGDPSPLFQQRLITWIRQELHPSLLLNIGLQPSIGAGFVLRTTNKYYDFSLRHRFIEQRDLLKAQLHGGAPSTDQTQAQPPDAIVPAPEPVTTVPSAGGASA